MLKNGFTLIELLIAIAIATVIVGAVYWSLNAALESWGYSRDQLALQKVLSDVMEQVLSGTVDTYGIKDSLEIITAGVERIEFVPPWTDDSHTAAAVNFIYTLNRKIKPGTAVPIGEIKLPESNKFRLVPVKKVELEDSDKSQVRLGLAAPLGSELKFTYHPDPKASEDVIKAIWWEPEAKQVYCQDKEGVENLSLNPFGVEITQMILRYYDNTNKPVTEYSFVDERDLNVITGVEVFVEAKLDQYTQSLVSFTNLRNSPMRSGYLTLREGSRLPIADSHNIQTLLLTNLSGVSDGDELQIDATPRSGKTWRIKLKFQKSGQNKAKLESYTIEYPPQHPVYTEYPQSSIDAGLNLLSLGGNGFYDYDDDEDVEDVVLLEGDVILEVTKMDIEGAGLFVRP